VALRRVLIANRGEIAARIIRGCRTVGVECVAAYADADHDAPYVRAADDAVRLGPSDPHASYLSVDAVVAAAARTGCDAVHPGYGFLSEQPLLAEACDRAGLVFVGPSAHALRTLGDKVAARRLARASGFTVVEGSDDPSTVALPLIVKAAAGGGGRGMRVVRSREDLAAALEAAGREALAAFGDGRLYAEEYLEGARHIEVQALADGQGGAAHLGLRDCSLQRRHQKVIEEAPAPGVSVETVEALGAAACRLLRAVEYQGAATIELLRAADGRLFFLEVNARLQVEHPVTELVSGVDLVAWQLRIAGGERLAATIAWQPHGHAVEARLVAEDPDNGFLPASGTLAALSFPPGVRVDNGYEAGQVVPAVYDGLLAKIIAHAETRDAAFRLLEAALADVVVLGVTTNLPLLRRLVADPAVRDGRLDTTLLERVWEPADRAGFAEAALKAAAVYDSALMVAADPFQGRFRIGHAGVRAIPTARTPDGVVHTLIGGRDVAVTWPAPPSVDDAAHRHAADHQAVSVVTSPMAGRVVVVAVSVGMRVAAGDTLVVVEAMKMEHPVVAPYDATVTAVRCEPGGVVSGGGALVEIEA
jgi:acetyl-CoA/propionyl-CoA carboxylase, biotin carboxylase, biotin carboxyl carrier protein